MAGAGVRDTLIEGPWRHRDLPANGIRFHVAVGEHFATDRPLVLLLHGFPESWYAWRHQLPALDEAGYSAVALDLRGYGASDKTPRGYDARTSAWDLAAVVRSLGYRSGVLVGHDWGALAGWATAAYEPVQVRALVSIAAPHPLAFPWRSYARHLPFFQLPILPERAIMYDDGAYVEQLLRRWAAPGADFLTETAARHYRDALMLWPSPHCALEYQRMFVRDQLRAAGRDHRAALRRGVDLPVLSVHGQIDPLVPLGSMAAAEPYVRGGHELASLPGVGHLPHEEVPAVLNSLLLRWLSELPPAPTRHGIPVP